MTDLMRQLTARKVERRRQLAALPVGEKLRMLEEMVAATKAISATRPPKPVNAVTNQYRSLSAESASCADLGL